MATPTFEFSNNEILKKVSPENRHFFIKYFTESDDEEFLGFPDVGSVDISEEENLAASVHTHNEEYFLDSDGDERLFVSDSLNNESSTSDTDDSPSFYEHCWVELKKGFFDFPIRHSFTGRPGKKDETAKKPLDFFKLFFTDETFEEIAMQTNIYGRSLLKNHEAEFGSPYSLINKFRGNLTTAEEMKKFVALLLTTGLVQKQIMEHYWSTDLVVQTPFFSKIMSRTRFSLLFRCLHLSDNRIARPKKGEFGYDPLAKLGELFTDIIERFKTCYIPSREIFIDEIIIGDKGKIYFQACDSQNPEKYGIKLHVLSDSNTFYTWNVIMCSDNRTLETGTSNIDNAYAMIVKLMDNLLNQGYHIHMDWWYTSPALYQALYEKKTHATGTVMLSRCGLPRVALGKKLENGDSISFRKGPLLVMKWHNKKDITVLSSFHNADMLEIQQKRKQRKTHETTTKTVLKPKCIVKYNTAKGGLDYSEQYLQYYPLKYKCLKWWKKLFIHLVNMAVVNAYILYKQTKPEQMQYDFRLALIKELIDDSIGLCEQNETK